MYINTEFFQQDCNTLQVEKGTLHNHESLARVTSRVGCPACPPYNISNYRRSAHLL